MENRFETFRSDKRIVALQSLQVSYLSIIHKIFYETLKLKNSMCELCMFNLNENMQLKIVNGFKCGQKVINTPTAKE